VVEAITAKMIRRHPHVFERSEADTPDKVKAQWTEIKAEEKAERQARRAARGSARNRDARDSSQAVPRALPALMEALKLQEAASRVGFDWGEAGPVLDKIEEEIGELRAGSPSAAAKRQTDELGDVIFAVANLARHLKTDPEDALRPPTPNSERGSPHVESGAGKAGQNA
jgi:ATP diphosphatase